MQPYKTGRFVLRYDKPSPYKAVQADHRQAVSWICRDAVVNAGRLFYGHDPQDAY